MIDPGISVTVREPFARLSKVRGAAPCWAILDPFCGMRNSTQQLLSQSWTPCASAAVIQIPGRTDLRVQRMVFPEDQQQFSQAECKYALSTLYSTQNVMLAKLGY